MLHLTTPSHINTARKVMENTKCHFTQYIPKHTDLVFSAVDHFKERLLYGKVVPNATLDRLSFLLIERFQDAGLKTPGNHESFTPHMTRRDQCSNSSTQKSSEEIATRASAIPTSENSVWTVSIYVLRQDQNKTMAFSRGSTLCQTHC